MQAVCDGSVFHSQGSRGALDSGSGKGRGVPNTHAELLSNNNRSIDPLGQTGPLLKEFNQSVLDE